MSMPRAPTRQDRLPAHAFWVILVMALFVMTTMNASLAGILVIRYSVFAQTLQDRSLALAKLVTLGTVFLVLTWTNARSTLTTVILMPDALTRVDLLLALAT